MSELAVCPQCKRHVRVAAIHCPFCATAVSGLRARNVIPRAFTRAAIFSAALAGCGEHKKPPAATAGSAIESGSSTAPVAADATGPGSDMGSAGSANALAADAAMPDDAATPDDAGAGSGSNAAAIKSMRELKKKELRVNHRQMAKPYGAPPARRRIV